VEVLSAASRPEFLFWLSEQLAAYAWPLSQRKACAMNALQYPLELRAFPTIKPS
jgi:hypothetical protein